MRCPRRADEPVGKAVVRLLVEPVRFRIPGLAHGARHTGEPYRVQPSSVGTATTCRLSELVMDLSTEQTGGTFRIRRWPDLGTATVAAQDAFQRSRPPPAHTPAIR
jgi:hypothetical protein